MRYLLLIFLIGCHDKTNLQSADCGKPCGTAKTIGICHPGVWQCQDGPNPTCIGEVLPKHELCNNIDDDCNGIIDDVIQLCSSVCGTGVEMCSSGKWVGCNARQPAQEICNGIDDNCDGQIDEPENLPVSWCYSGPPNTLQFGVCHPGVNRCINGQLVCENQQLPSPEACNGIDDNCDGLVDNSTQDSHPVDLIFIVDNSGSMTGVMINIKLALINLANSYQNHPEIKWAIVGAPDIDFNTWASSPHLFQDLTDISTFIKALNLQNGATGSALEPTVDAIQETANNQLQLTWQTDSNKLIILFSDELPQSYTNPTIPYQQSIQTCIDSKIKVIVFSNLIAAPEWNQISSGTGGAAYSIYSNPADIELGINKFILTANCR